MSEGELLDIVQVKYILQQGSQVQRKIAVNWLKKQDTRETVDMLIQTFTDVYWLVRRMAADAVAELGEKYSDQVISALDDENLDINYWSIQVLAKWGGDYHRPILKALDHPSDEVKSYAVKALRGFPHEDIMLRLIDLLDYENWHLRRLSADSLEHMGEPAIPFLKNAFKKHLTDKHGEDISYWTCRILSKLLEKESLSFLKKLLSSQFDNLRYHAIGALGDIEGSKSLPALIKSFNDRSWVVRAKASAVIEAKGAAVIPYLKKAFLKGNSDIKYWTIKLIAKILKSKAIPVIDDLIHQVPGEVDFYAVSALGEINSEAAIDPLIECFQSSSWLIRQTAAEMLKKMGNRPMDKLIKALDSEYEDVQFFAIQVLSHIGGRAIPILKKRLREGSTKTKLAVINAFGKQESKGVEQALIDALSDSEWVVRNQSAIALEELGPDVVEELIQVFDEWHEDKNFWSVQIMKSLFPAVLKNLEDYLCSDDEYRVWQTTCGYIMLAKELGDQDRKLLFESFSRTTGGDKASLLVDFLRHFKKDYCSHIVFLLEKITSHVERIQLLKTYFNSDNYNIRYFTVLALLRIGTLDSIEVVAEAMDSPVYGEKVTLVLEAMKDQLHGFPHTEIIERKFTGKQEVSLDEKVEKMFNTEDVRSVESMLALIDIENVETRMTLAESVAKVTLPKVMFSYIKYIKQLDNDYQEDILNKLNKLKTDVFLTTIAGCLPLSQDDVYRYVQNLLAMFTTTEQRLQYLRIHLHHMELDFRYSIIDYFYELDLDDAKDILLEEIVKERERFSTIYIFDYLCQKLFKRNYVTRNKAMEFLKSLGSLVVELLVEVMILKKLSPIELMSFENLLHELGQEAREVLRKLAESDKKDVAKQANRLLSHL